MLLRKTDLALRKAKKFALNKSEYVSHAAMENH